MADPRPRDGGQPGPEADQDRQALPDPDLDLTCPGCGVALAADEVFAVYRVCPGCRRHFPLPARERLALLLDPGGFEEINAALLSLDPLVFHDHLPFPDRLAEVQELVNPPGLAEGVITGVGTIGGVPGMVIALDLAPLGGAIGALAGEKITLALEQAVADRLPVVALCAGGRGPELAQEGMLALVQLAKIAAAAADLRRAGLPLIAVLAHPTTGGVYVGLANQADVVLAEPGARIGLSLGSEQRRQEAGAAVSNAAEALLANGLLDSIVERSRLRASLSDLLDLLTKRGIARPELELATRPAATPVSPRWEEGALARHPDRPTSRTYLPHLFGSFFELHGDRVGGDDPAVVCGLGRLGGLSVAVVAQERGSGGMRPDGYRKADRVMRLAGRLELPVVVLIDAPGPAIEGEMESAGLGVALAQALGRSSVLPVPIVTAIVGEAGGVGAIALGSGDLSLMLEHAVYTVPGPGGGRLAARAAQRAADAGGGGRCLTARECQRLGVVEVVVPEPAPAAHADPAEAARLLRLALTQAFAELSGVGSRRLLAERSRRLRTLGMTTPEGRAAARREALALLDLQDLPRNLARSFGEWRDRLEARYRETPRRVRPQLHLSRPELAARISTLRANVAGAVARAGAQLDKESGPTVDGGQTRPGATAGGSTDPGDST